MKMAVMTAATLAARMVATVERTVAAATEGAVKVAEGVVKVAEGMAMEAMAWTTRTTARAGAARATVRVVEMAARLLLETRAV